MSLELHLRRSRPCAVCDGTAVLREGIIEQDLGNGSKVIVDAIPVYRCQRCGEESVEITSAAKLEEYLAGYLKDIKPGDTARIMLLWEKTFSDDISEGRLLPKETTLQLVS